MNKLHSTFRTDTFHTNGEKKSLILIIDKHSAFSLACESNLKISSGGLAYSSDLK